VAHPLETTQISNRVRGLTLKGPPLGGVRSQGAQGRIGIIGVTSFGWRHKDSSKYVWFRHAIASSVTQHQRQTTRFVIKYHDYTLK